MNPSGITTHFVSCCVISLKQSPGSPNMFHYSCWCHHNRHCAFIVVLNAGNVQDSLAPIFCGWNIYFYLISPTQRDNVSCKSIQFHCTFCKYYRCIYQSCIILMSYLWKEDKQNCLHQGHTVPLHLLQILRMYFLTLSLLYHFNMLPLKIKQTSHWPTTSTSMQYIDGSELDLMDPQFTTVPSYLLPMIPPPCNTHVPSHAQTHMHARTHAHTSH